MSEAYLISEENKVVTFVINYSKPVCDFFKCLYLYDLKLEKLIWCCDTITQDNSIDMFKSSIHCDENDICDSGVKPFTSNCNFYTYRNKLPNVIN